ncbi:putative signal transducing protein [Maribellus mangrovi]|uniref:putative signal transducing protein n=1 Tax=Maribellus mangrovi TaxID=3133146 RepID=UPI0030EBFE16
MSDSIMNIFTGDEIIVNRIKQELEQQGINCLIKDGFKQGIQAGFVGGVQSAIEVYVDEKDLEKALETVQAITQE